MEVAGERPVTTVDWSRTESRSVTGPPPLPRSGGGMGRGRFPRGATPSLTLPRYAGEGMRCGLLSRCRRRQLAAGGGPGDHQLFLRHVGRNVGEQWRAEVALP